LDLGGDWGTIDPQTSIFQSNTRSNLQTDDGANIYVQTSGTQVNPPLGEIHVRIQLETGDRRYYWINNAIVIGILRPVSQDETGFVLRLDAYHVSSFPDAV
jgi:vacuolar protein sorting-associated protein 16